jgi:hypothetical protein
MPCLLAFLVFAVLGIFGLRYRQLAREALRCAFRGLLWRPCESRLDEKIKSRVVGRVLNRSPLLARLLHRFWTPLSWALLIILLLSSLYSVRALYYLARYQTCNPQQPASCPLILPQQGEKCRCEDEIGCRNPGEESCATPREECDACAECEPTSTKAPNNKASQSPPPQ